MFDFFKKRAVRRSDAEENANKQPDGKNIAAPPKDDAAEDGVQKDAQQSNSQPSVNVDWDSMFAIDEVLSTDENGESGTEQPDGKNSAAFSAEGLFASIRNMNFNINDEQGILKAVADKWIKDIPDGELFFEHGYDVETLGDRLAQELNFACELKDREEYSREEKNAIIFTLESLMSVSASNVIAWKRENGLPFPALTCSPWRRGASYSSRDAASLNPEKINPSQIDGLINCETSASPFYNPYGCGIKWAEDILKGAAKYTGLLEDVDFLGQGFPYKQTADTASWGGITTMLSPFESGPSLIQSPLVSSIEFSDDVFRQAAENFLDKEKDIIELYYMMSKQIVSRIEHKHIAKDACGSNAAEYIERMNKNVRFAGGVFRFADDGMWRVFDEIVDKYRIQGHEVNGNFGTGKTGEKVFDSINVSPSDVSFAPADPITKRKYLTPDISKLAAKKGAVSVPLVEKDLNEIVKSFKTADEWDTLYSPALWRWTRNIKRTASELLLIRALNDIKRHMDDITAECRALEKALAEKSNIQEAYESARTECGIMLNGMPPSQRFFTMDTQIVLSSDNCNMKLNSDMMEHAVDGGIKYASEKQAAVERCPISKKEQEDHLRAMCLGIHTITAYFADVMEGRNPLAAWSPDIYSSMQDHTISDELFAGTDAEKNDASLKKRDFGWKPDILREKFKYSAKESLTSTEWNERELCIPSPNFRPYTDRCDEMTERQLLMHGLSGTQLGKGQTRENGDCAYAARLLKWKLRNTAGKSATAGKDGSNFEKLNLSGGSDRRRVLSDAAVAFCKSYAQTFDSHAPGRDELTADMFSHSNDSACRTRLLKVFAEAWALDKTALMVKRCEDIKWSDSIDFKRRMSRILANNNNLDICTELKIKENAITNEDIINNIVRKNKNFDTIAETIDPFLIYNFRLLPSTRPLLFMRGSPLSTDCSMSPLGYMSAPILSPITGRPRNDLSLYDEGAQMQSVFDAMLRKMAMCGTTPPLPVMPTGIELGRLRNINSSMMGRGVYEAVLDNMLRFASYGPSALAGIRMYYPYDKIKNDTADNDERQKKIKKSDFENKMAAARREAAGYPIIPSKRASIVLPIFDYFDAEGIDEGSNKRVLLSKEDADAERRGMFLLLPRALQQRLYTMKESAIEWSAYSFRYSFLPLNHNIRRANNALLCWDKRWLDFSVVQPEGVSRCEPISAGSSCVPFFSLRDEDSWLMPGSVLIFNISPMLFNDKRMLDLMRYENTPEYTSAVSDPFYNIAGQNWNSAALRCISIDLALLASRESVRRGEGELMLSSYGGDRLFRYDPSIEERQKEITTREAGMINYGRLQMLSDIFDIRRAMINDEKDGFVTGKKMIRESQKFEMLKNMMWQRYRHNKMFSYFACGSPVQDAASLQNSVEAIIPLRQTLDYCGLSLINKESPFASAILDAGARIDYPAPPRSLEKELKGTAWKKTDGKRALFFYDENSLFDCEQSKVEKNVPGTISGVKNTRKESMSYIPDNRHSDLSKQSESVQDEYADTIPSFDNTLLKSPLADILSNNREIAQMMAKQNVKNDWFPDIQESLMMENCIDKAISEAAPEITEGLRVITFDSTPPAGLFASNVKEMGR